MNTRLTIAVLVFLCGSFLLSPVQASPAGVSGVVPSLQVDEECTPPVERLLDALEDIEDLEGDPDLSCRDRVLLRIARRYLDKCILGSIEERRFGGRFHLIAWKVRKLACFLRLVPEADEIRENLVFAAWQFEQIPEVHGFAFYSEDTSETVEGGWSGRC